MQHAPTPETLRAWRIELGMTQAECASLVFLADGKRWSEYERGVVPIDPARFELFAIKLGRHQDYVPAARMPAPGSMVPA